ncbi:MAG: hypothetical protein LDL41_15015 [Coleofasciculus sp. S288]|nr:hypothetical protein [Coleofasciculus sp. S288]
MVREWQRLTRISIWSSLLLVILIAAPLVAPTTSQPSQTQLEQRRIRMLESALAPQTAEEAVLTWARGVKTRNGALQFAVFSPELRSKREADYVAANWVTGASSPWVESYKIIRQEQDAEGWEFEVEYQLASSVGSEGTSIDRIRVEQLPLTEDHPEGWYITQLDSAPTNLIF